MTVIAGALPRATRWERLLLGASRLLQNIAVERMRARHSTAVRDAHRAALDDRARNTTAAVHLGMLPR